ncbi:MAG: alpha/beta hydrolase [Ilumatobacteraceae bacterium]
MACVTANGITIEYEEQGTGEPLLLVMGLGGQLIDWPPDLIQMLVDRGFRVIRFDNRDSGLSTEFADEVPPTRGQLAKALLLRRDLPSPYSLGDMAADAVGLLDALDIDRAHVVGMSMGGMIAQQIAIDHPTRVISLVSIMSTTGNLRVGRPKARIIARAIRRPDPTPETAVEQGVKLFGDITGPTFDADAFRELFQADLERSYRPQGTARNFAAILSSGDRTGQLEQLDVPTLVIHGLVDSLVRPSGGIATARAIPNARLLMFNDMGHDLPHTRHREIADAIAANGARAKTLTDA